MISLVRVDNRLLHGQILETWIPRLGIGEIVVADDEAAASPLTRAAMMLCVPPDLPVRVEAVRDVSWSRLALSPSKVLVLVRDVPALLAAREAGLGPELAPRVNVGNVHFGPGRRPVSSSVFLTDEEVNALHALSAAGYEVEARAIPSETPAGIAEIERRYAGTPKNP